jgi:hypothetical protein
MIFKQRLCLSLTRWLRSFTSFSSVFQWQLLSELFPQWRMACPQVPEISSVAQRPSCFGVGFSLCWFSGGLFICLTPFLWGKVSDPPADPLLSACCDGQLIVFKFCSVVWLWMLLTGSGDEFCGPLSALFHAADYHLPAVSPSAFLVFVYWKFLWRSAPCSPPFSGALTALPLLCCVLVFSFLFMFSFLLHFILFFCRARGQSAQGAMLVYSRGYWGNTAWHLVLTCWSAKYFLSGFGADIWQS